MIEPFLQSTSLFALGIVLGLKHSLDSDHLVAVATIVSHAKNIKKSSQFGALWGVGHTLTLAIVGTILLVTRFTIPKQLALSFEAVVGAMLVALGVKAIVVASREKVHFHRHLHDGVVHSHLHSHRHALGHAHTHLPFVVGIVHGLAGSGALTLLVLAGATSVFQGLIFILVFGVGSIIGMLMMGTIFGWSFLFIKRFRGFNQILKISVGALSAVFGLAIVYEIGIIQGLFF